MSQQEQNLDDTTPDLNDMSDSSEDKDPPKKSRKRKFSVKHIVGKRIY